MPNEDWGHQLKVASKLQGGTARKRNKYNAKKVTIEDHEHGKMVFDSQKEYRRWCELRTLEKAGQIVCLQHHRRYDIKINGESVASYEADFTYTTKAGEAVIEDVKSPPTRKTPYYRLKKRMFEAQTGLEIREV